MKQNATGKRQHIVPQQMIRQFAGPDGKLVGMVKPSMQIGARRRGPRGILYQDHYYNDPVTDFDATFLRQIEQQFADAYPKILNAARIDGHAGAAFVDWVASMVVRTPLLATLAEVMLRGSRVPAAELLPEAQKTLVNLLRFELFRVHRNLFVRERWRWATWRFRSPCFVLTDHPVCMTGMHTPGGQVIIVPMSSNIVMLGGAQEGVEIVRSAKPMLINLFLAANADHHIFACDRAILEDVKAALSGDAYFTQNWMEAARKPLFGLPDRIREKMRSDPLPAGFNSGAALREYADSFGRPRWEVEP